MRPVAELQRAVKPFEVIDLYSPSGDQPTAIAELTERLRAGGRGIVLLGVTGTSRPATTTWLVEQVQRPTLILGPDKTLAAQMAAELRGLLPSNAVEYFVSYYDYYRPKAYVPQTDTFIEKDSSISDEIEHLRHNTTSSLLARRDVVVVSSVSCVYSLGTPRECMNRMAPLEVDQQIDRDDLLRRFMSMQYTRSDIDFIRGTFHVRDDTVEIIPTCEELAIRIEFFGDEIEALATLHLVAGDIIDTIEQIFVFPASYYVAGPGRMQKAIEGIEAKLAERLAQLEHDGRLLEAQRLRMRTTYDLEMPQQIGMCSGIRDCSLHIDGHETGTPPNTLLDYFPEDFLLVIDESHVIVPQIGVMHEGDASRKRTPVEHRFRLPSVLGSRPLTFAEFEDRIGQTVYLSATPGGYETQRPDDVVEQTIRPTGLVDPKVVVKPTQGQISDLLEEVRARMERQEWILVTTLTKRMVEGLTAYLAERGVRVKYLHSDVDMLRRVELLCKPWLGRFGVLVGINLLREGLDLPEVSLVSILDADKEGFLRSTRSLVQATGRIARNVSGEAYIYVDTVTSAMAEAIEETERRRTRQLAYNAEHGIDPQPLRKKIADVTDILAREDVDTADLLAGGYRGHEDFSVRARRERTTEATVHEELAGAAQGDLAELINEFAQQMHAAAGDLHFELAARLRDEIQDLEKELRAIRTAD